MTECPPEIRPACFPQLGEESIRGYASRHAQLSVRGKQVLDRLLVLLPTHLKSQPSSPSRASPFPPMLLFSISDILQHARVDGSAEQNVASVLPSVLSKLRVWRLLESEFRCSPGGIHKLALDLAEIADEASAPTSSDLNRTSHAHLRMRWVSSDSPSESQDREPSSSTPPSPSRSDVPDSKECAHALRDLNKRRSDTRYESCQAGRLATPDSEDASPVVPQRHRSVSGFRSGCSACRHPRVSGPSIPPSPQMARMAFNDVNHSDKKINSTALSPRHHPKLSVQHTTPKKPKREKHKPLQSVSRGIHVDENEPPLPIPTGVQQGIGISFPRQRTHFPRISNAHSPREPSSPAAASVSVQRRVEPSHLPNGTREGDKHMSSHRVTVASVGLRLPIMPVLANRSPKPTLNSASPIDLHPHSPTRAQSFSYTHTSINSHHGLGLGSIAGRVQKLSSNAAGSRSSRRLPSWSQSHLCCPLTATTTTASVKPTGSPSPSPAKASAQNQNPHPFSRSRPANGTSIPSDMMMRPRDRRSVSSQAHKHTQSANPVLSSP